MWHVKKVGGSFPTLINSCRRKSKEITKDEKREKKKGENEETRKMKMKRDEDGSKLEKEFGG